MGCYYCKAVSSSRDGREETREVLRSQIDSLLCVASRRLTCAKGPAAGVSMGADVLAGLAMLIYLGQLQMHAVAFMLFLPLCPNCWSGLFWQHHPA